MAKYKIYAGLGGGFGGGTLQGTEEFDSEEEAGEYAWETACEIYDSYGGLHGLRTLEDIINSDESEGGDVDVAYDIFMEERENWLSYWIQEVKDSESEPLKS